MRANAARIKAWAQSPGKKAPLPLKQHVAGNIGYGVPRATGKLITMNTVRVVLKYETYNGMPYYVLTAHLLY